MLRPSGYEESRISRAPPKPARAKPQQDALPGVMLQSWPQQMLPLLPGSAARAGIRDLAERVAKMNLAVEAGASTKHPRNLHQASVL